MKKALILTVLCGVCIFTGAGCVSVHESQPEPTATTHTTTTESHSVRAAY